MTGSNVNFANIQPLAVAQLRQSVRCADIMQAPSGIRSSTRLGSIDNTTTRAGLRPNHPERQPETRRNRLGFLHGGIEWRFILIGNASRGVYQSPVRAPPCRLKA
jgi:hypothetical protein